MTLENQLLTRHYVRQLYTQLGEPTADEFPGIHNIVSSFARVLGYTTHIDIVTPQDMRQEPVDYQIKRPSEIKERIIDKHYNDGWSIRVLAFNVMCHKYVASIKHPHLAVRITNSRDTATYEYVLIGDDDDSDN